MRALNATTHFIAAVAVTAAAIATAFAIPAANAMTITIFGKDSGNMIVGSDRDTALARKVAPFTTLRLEDSVDVTAHPGPNPGVVVHADDNIAPLIETAVEGDALVVRMHKGTSFRTHRRIWVEVEFASLSATQQHGSGDLHVTTVSGSKLDSSIAGSGDAHVNATDALQARVAGSGDVTYSGHPHDISRDVAGSGSVEAR